MSVNVRIYRVFGSEVERLHRATENELHRLFFGRGWEMDPERTLDLGKSWEAVNYVLAGRGGRPPHTFLADETTGEPIDYEFAHGPGRLIEPRLVKEISASVSSLPSSAIEARLDDTSSMNQLYPFSFRSYTPGDRAWVAQSFSELSAFVGRAAKLDCSLLVGSF